MAVFLKNEQEIFPIDEQKVIKEVELVLAEEKCEHDLSITLVDNARIQELHKEYLDKDTDTDVLSFPLLDKNDEDNVLGEVVVSAEKALFTAAELAADPEAELMLYIIHGFLHLMGYDDKDQQKKMEMHSREDKLLSFLGYT